jgi:hypothetical protein
MSAADEGRPWEQYHEECHPKQRIFLSVDAIGSTALKTSLAKAGATSGVWVKELDAFLPEVVTIYFKQFTDLVGRHCANCRNPCTSKGEAQSSSNKVRPKVWKYLGDEAVLVAELTCKKRQSSLHVLSLAKTIEFLNNKFASEDFRLRFKGTAWVAAFPVTNVELDLRIAEDQTTRDFLGPSMDLGLRLAKYASEDRLIISASLAYLVIMGGPFEGHINFRGVNESSMPLCFGGTIEAKGIRTGKHPLIWLPLKSDRESELCKTQQEQLKAYLEEEWFGESIPPFILDADDREAPSPDYARNYIEAAMEQMGIDNSLFNKYAKVAEAGNTSKEGAEHRMEIAIAKLERGRSAPPTESPEK